MMVNIKAEQPRGYLKENFLFFHLKDNIREQFNYHHHDFYKIIIFISGKVTYLIEGQSYSLQPWDILLITGRDIHKPLIDTKVDYERYVIWFKPAYLLKNSLPGNNLLTCFESASEQRQYLTRPNPEAVRQLTELVVQLEKADVSEAFGSPIAKNAFFLLLVIQLNRLFKEAGQLGKSQSGYFDETIGQLIDFIGNHLAEELLIDDLSEKFYISKYSLMHKFKRQTGYSIHNFILQKRLLTAHELIKRGYPYMEASSRSGFSDYSCFVRAFTKYFGLSPRKYYERLRQAD